MLNDQASVETLIPLLGSYEKEEREAAAKALEALGEGELANAVLDVIDGDGKKGEEDLLDLVAETGDKRAGKALIACVSGRHKLEARKNACRVLGKIGDLRAMDAIMAFFISSQHAEEASCEALILLGAKTAVGLLTKSFQRDTLSSYVVFSPAVRAICKALRILGDDQAIETCLKALRYRKNDEYIQGVRNALGERAIYIRFFQSLTRNHGNLSGTAPLTGVELKLAALLSRISQNDQEASKELISLIKEGHTAVILPLIEYYNTFGCDRNEAFDSVLNGYIEISSDIEALLRILECSNANLLQHACEALEKIGLKEPSVINGLIGCLDDLAENVRQAAYKAIVRLTGEASEETRLAKGIYTICNTDLSAKENGVNILWEFAARGHPYAVKGLILHLATQDERFSYQPYGLHERNARNMLIDISLQEKTSYFQSQLTAHSFSEEMVKQCIQFLDPNHYFSWCWNKEKREGKYWAKITSNESAESKSIYFQIVTVACKILGEIGDQQVVEPLLRWLLVTTTDDGRIIHNEDLHYDPERDFFNTKSLFFHIAVVTLTALERLGAGELGRVIIDLFGKYWIIKDTQAHEAFKQLQDHRIIKPMFDFLKTHPYYDGAIQVLEDLGEDLLAQVLSDIRILSDKEDSLKILLKQGNFLIVELLESKVKEYAIDPIRLEEEKQNGGERQAKLMKSLEVAFQIMEPQLNELFCPKCFTRFEIVHFELKQGPHEYRKLITKVIHCRSCGKCEALREVKQVVCVLDQNTTQADEQPANGILRVNWFKRKKLFDFDKVEIRHADEQQVTAFLNLIKNDNDPFRKHHYKRMNCLIYGKDSPLTKIVKQYDLFHKEPKEVG